MTRHELETALIAAGWETKCTINNDVCMWKMRNSEYHNFSFNDYYFIYQNIIEIDIDKCRLIEVPMKDGTQYRAIVCDTLDGLFLRLEL